MARPEMTEPNINPLPLKKGRIHFEKKNVRRNGNIDIGIILSLARIRKICVLKKKAATIMLHQSLKPKAIIAGITENPAAIFFYSFFHL
jgi:hypothetical protein